MNKGLTAFILLLVFLVVVLTISIAQTVLIEEPSITEEQIEQDVYAELSTYLQIKDKLGRYYGEYPNQKIEKVAILVTPLVSQQINLFGLTVKLNDGETVKYIDYCGDSAPVGSYGLFEHPLWDSIINTFGLLVLNDDDNSVEDYDVINKKLDMAYVIFKLSGGFAMSRGETLIVTLFPSTGWQRTAWLEAPLPIKKVVTF